ncbi:hypothetical protein OKW50_002214 [Paraburkholderia youngii]
MRPRPDVTRTSLKLMRAGSNVILPCARSAAAGSARSSVRLWMSSFRRMLIGPDSCVGRTVACSAFRSSRATFRSSWPCRPLSVPPPVSVALRTSRTFRLAMLCVWASSRTSAFASISGSSFWSIAPAFALTIEIWPATAKPAAGSTGA